MTRTVESDLVRHAVSKVWGDMPSDELLALSLDIEANGQQEPVFVINNNEVVDGWHRFRACQMAQKPVQVKDLPRDVDLFKFVVSKNLHRRHLTASQRACIAVEALPELEKRAKARQKAVGGVNPGPLPEKIPEALKGDARDHAAEQFQVNPRYISDVKRIAAEEPELYDAIRTGDMSLPEAKREAKRREEKLSSAPTPDTKTDAKPKAPTKLQMAENRINELERLCLGREDRIGELEAELRPYRITGLPDGEKTQLNIYLQARVDALESQLRECMAERARLQHQVNVMTRERGR